MIISHEQLNKPGGNKIIWRYMSINKFLDLLINKKLYFPKITKLNDQHEMPLPKEYFDRWKEDYLSNGYDNTRANIYHKHDVKRFLEQRGRYFVNCWSMEASESYALWKIYLDGGRQGVAIKTNVSRLKKSISSKNDMIYLCPVSYQENSFPEGQDLDFFILASTKKKYYEYEKELRLVVEGEGSEEDKTYDLNLEELIIELYVSPFQGKWFFESLKKLIELYSPVLAQRLTTSDIRDR